MSARDFSQRKKCRTIIRAHKSSQKPFLKCIMNGFEQIQTTVFKFVKSKLVKIYELDDLTGG
jgi:hypothetical protein